MAAIIVVLSSVLFNDLSKLWQKATMLPIEIKWNIALVK